MEAVRLPLRSFATTMAESSSFRHLKEMNVIELENYLGTVYIGPVVVNGIEYHVQIDTGSADLWISCHYYEGFTCWMECPVNAVAIQYGSGNVCVEPNVGTVLFGPILLPDYTFGIGNGLNVIPSNTNGVMLGGSQGILGLAYRKVAALTQPNGQLINMIRNFSLYLSPIEDAEGSELLINAVDHERIKQFNLIPYSIQLKKAAHWTIPLRNFRTTNYSDFMPCQIIKRSKSCNAIVDSGTSFLTAPEFVFQQFAKRYLIPFACELSKTGYYICPRTIQLPVLYFELGSDNHIFKLNPWDYTRVYSSQQVVIQLQQTPSGSVSDSWILGDTFLKVYYTTYIVNQAVVFYCRDGKCNGGENLLDFPRNATSPWVHVLIIIVSIGSAGFLLYIIRAMKQPESTLLTTGGCAVALTLLKIERPRILRMVSPSTSTAASIGYRDAP